MYWHTPESTPHGKLLLWFYNRMTPVVLRAREERMEAMEAAVAPLADAVTVRSAEEWTTRVKESALAIGADAVGITQVQPLSLYEGYEVKQKWAIVICGKHRWDELRTAPADAEEVIRQYGRGIRIAKRIAGSLPQQGHDATPHGGPRATPTMLISPVNDGCGNLPGHRCGNWGVRRQRSAAETPPTGGRARRDGACRAGDWRTSQSKAW